MAPALSTTDCFAEEHSVYRPTAGMLTVAEETLRSLAAEHGKRVEARLPPTLPDRASFELLLPGGARRALRLIERAPLVDSRDGTALAWLVPLTPAGTFRRS